MDRISGRVNATRFVQDFAIVRYTADIVIWLSSYLDEETPEYLSGGSASRPNPIDRDHLQLQATQFEKK